MVATDSGGPGDFINDDVGKLVPCKDVNALADGIDYVLEHYEDYSSEKLAQYARERYSYEVVGKQLDKIYRTVYNGIGPRYDRYSDRK